MNEITNCVERSLTLDHTGGTGSLLDCNVLIKHNLSHYGALVLSTYQRTHITSGFLILIPTY